ncbi:MAB_1171c family putative transporter [Lentzea sp. NPDC034063]|uniref:MAB_1171c family putative transporter n=1 Tax=unclassified Lentzea TaxID=2643253 RepID=UPI0033F102B2
MAAAVAAHLVLVAVIAAAALNRCLAWRRNPSDQAARAVFFALVCMEISTVLGLSAIYWPVHRAFGGLPGFPQLPQHLASMGTAYFAVVFTLAVVRPGTSVRSRARLLAVASALLGVCYLLGPVRLGLPLLGERGHADAGVLAYVLVWQLYSAFAMADVVRLAWIHRTRERGVLRASLTLMGIGCALTIAHAVHKVTYSVAVWLGAPPSWDEHGLAGVQILLIAPAGLFLLAGLLLPSANAEVRRYRLYRRLAPLATALGVSSPGVRGSRARLLNRVIGIRDALIGPLRSHLDAAVYDAALASASAAGLNARAYAEAACIDAALLGGPGGRLPEFHAPAADEEATWLAEVSTAYAALQTSSGSMEWRRRTTAP